MKKFLAIVMCLTLALSMMTVVSSADELKPAFKVEAVTIDAGVTTATVQVFVENNPGITACAVAISYDPALTLAKKATNNNLFSGGSVVVGGNAAANPYKVNWSEDFDNFTESGTFFTLTFNVPADAAPGTVYPITVDYDQADVYDADMNDVVFEKINGSITIAGEVVTEPEVEVVEVPVAPSADNAVVTVMAVTGEPTAFGVEYAGVKYPSAATAEDLATHDYFAVELIGAEAAGITTYVE